MLIILYLLTGVFIIDLHLYFEKVTGCVRFFGNGYNQSFQLFLPFFAYTIHLLSTLSAVISQILSNDFLQLYKISVLSSHKKNFFLTGSINTESAKKKPNFL
jgi:hypothetical protein